MSFASTSKRKRSKRTTSGPNNTAGKSNSSDRKHAKATKGVWLDDEKYFADELDWSRYSHLPEK